METLETRCYDGMQEAMKTVAGLGIEYDEDIICDVCRDVSINTSFDRFKLVSLLMTFNVY